MYGRRAPNSWSGVSWPGPKETVGSTDLARWGSCGIPSAWRSPTTRRPRGRPRRNRCVHRVALPLGCCVVALGEAGGMPHPARPGPAAADSCARPSRRPARPARAWCGRASGWWSGWRSGWLVIELVASADQRIAAVITSRRNWNLTNAEDATGEVRRRAALMHQACQPSLPIPGRNSAFGVGWRPR
jgi:hypothetical protein